MLHIDINLCSDELLIRGQRVQFSTLELTKITLLTMY